MKYLIVPDATYYYVLEDIVPAYEILDEALHDTGICKPSRELSLAITRLEESRMWFDKAMRLQEDANR